MRALAMEARAVAQVRDLNPEQVRKWSPQSWHSILVHQDVNNLMKYFQRKHAVVSSICKLGGIFAIEESVVLLPIFFSHLTSKNIGVRDSSTIVGIDFAVNKCWWSKPKASRCIFCGTWPDFFIVHFMEYNRDVDVGEQDINRPSWHLTKKKSSGQFFLWIWMTHLITRNLSPESERQ